MNFKAQWCPLSWQLVPPANPSSWNRETGQNLGFRLKTKEQMDFSLWSCSVTGENRKFEDFREQKANKEKSYLLLDLILLNFK